MLAAEKLPNIISRIVRQALSNSEASVRKSAINRLVEIFLHRYDLLSIPLADSSRRPFRAGRQQISFVPTAIGLSNYQVKSAEEEITKYGTTLPPEMRKALLDLGWDKSGQQHTLAERCSVPLSVLPESFLHNEMMLASEGRAKSTEIIPPLLRRNSSAGSDKGLGKSNRPILVPTMAKQLLSLVHLHSDPDDSVRALARDALLNFGQS